MIIITVPHGKCDNVEKRECDIVARYVANRIYNYLNNAGIKNIKLYEASIVRSELDLNRIQSRQHQWRRDISDKIKNGDILLDIHSFPNMSFGSINGNEPKIVLLDDQKHRDLFDLVHEKISDSKYLIGSEKNDIIVDATKRGANATLWEFNESLMTDDDIDAFTQALIDYIKPTQSVRVVKLPMFNWTLILILVLIMLLVWFLDVYLTDTEKLNN